MSDKRNLFYKEESRKEYYKEVSPSQDGTYRLQREDLEFGCMLRIAEGIDKMANNWIELTKDRDHYKRRCEQLEERNKKLYHQVRAQKAATTRAKNQTKKNEESNN